MADSKPLQPVDSSLVALVKCGICFAVIDNPKALPCLHTFCLKCITDWSASSAEKNPEKYANAVSCPNCREDFPLPSGGIKYLKSNFFVTKLKEWNSLKQKLDEKDAKIPCTSCDELENQAIGRCVECNDFLCDKCVGSHKSLRVLKHHHVISLQELRDGKLAMHNLPEQEICPKHPGEVLRFYCETCDEPMCRDCTVVDHPRPDHKQVDLKSAARERYKDLGIRYEDCETAPKDIDAVIQKDEKLLKDLKSNVAMAIEQYSATSQQALGEFTGNIRMLETSRMKQIEAHKEGMQFYKARFCNSLMLTKQLTDNGSDHDVTSMYSDLVKQLSTSQPKEVRKSIAQVQFVPNKDLDCGLGCLGNLSIYESWALEKTIGKPTVQFNDPRSIVYSMTGQILVANYQGGNISVLGKDGSKQRDIVTNSAGGSDPQGCSRPFGLAISKEGSCFVTDLNPYVKVFDAEGNFKYRFSAKNPSGIMSHKDGSQLHGLVIDTSDRVFVGSLSGSMAHYISIHTQSGEHVSSFKIKIRPHFIVSTADHVIVSDYATQHGAASQQADRYAAIRVYDTNGNQLHIFDATPEKTYPTGLCLVDGEVLVASYAGNPAIHRFSVTGKYIGIVTKSKSVQSPYGMALRDDEEELVVADGKEIKVFHRK